MGFKRGNRVRVTAGSVDGKALKDAVGTVLSRSSCCSDVFEVEFDYDIKGHGEYGRCWYVHETDLILDKNYFLASHKRKGFLCSK